MPPCCIVAAPRLAGAEMFLVTGSPGVGKSRFIASLQDSLASRDIHLEGLVVSDLVRDEGIYEEYDKEFDTYVMDDSKVRRRLKEVLREPRYIVETHSVSVVPRKAISHVFVLVVPSTRVFYDRLKARGYSDRKIEENVDCEIMQVVWQDAVDRFGEESVTVIVNETEEQLNDGIQEAVRTISEIYSQP